MAYVLDTRFFVIIREYYQDVFPSFWKNMDTAAASGEISSVREVLREIERYGGLRGYMDDEWVPIHRGMFTEASPEEAAAVRDILAVREFDNLITQKAKRKGSPVADPFVIAKAMVAGDTVVTRELSTQQRNNSTVPHIPDVCAHFGVPCITPMDFMRAKGWEF